jgi:anti-sigma regulatory factor (Ser/Thr protein kinase)
MTSNAAAPPEQAPHEHTWQTLIEFTLSRESGSERPAVDRVTAAVQRLNWSAAQLEQLRLALAEAARKAVECSCRYDLEGALAIRVLIPENDPASRDAYRSNDQPTQFQAPKREAQQVGRPPARGWGFFLIEKAAPDSDGVGRHLLEVFLYPGGK